MYCVLLYCIENKMHVILFIEKHENFINDKIIDFLNKI
jgi:hypothetical protein